jgi:hypothetical protein
LLLKDPQIPNLEINFQRIFKSWWPLAISWIFIAVEVPAVSAFIARLDNPTINLASFGGVVEPLRLLLLSPTIMLLSASTALSKDMTSYLKMRYFMHWVGFALTVVHFLVAFTPLYFIVARDILGVPEEVILPARLGLMIMLPIPWSVGYRRFQQGAMIRFGHSDAVVVGTLIRLATVMAVLLAGLMSHRFSGIVVGAGALSTGMVVEAIYSGLRIRPIIRSEIATTPYAEMLTWKTTLAFYIPLVMTSLINMMGRSINSAAFSRMPGAIDSLAVWPVIWGLVFLLQSLGVSYNEVVISYMGSYHTYKILKRFTTWLTLFVFGLTVLIWLTPLAGIWFNDISAIPGQLARAAESGLWLLLPVPAMNVLQSWYQGMILFGKKPRGVTESIIVYLAVGSLILIAGIVWKRYEGVLIGAMAASIAYFIQIIWLWVRSRAIVAVIRAK